jgi:hypothetical protein
MAVDDTDRIDAFAKQWRQSENSSEGVIFPEVAVGLRSRSRRDFGNT